MCLTPRKANTADKIKNIMFFCWWGGKASAVTPWCIAQAPPFIINEVFRGTAAPPEGGWSIHLIQVLQHCSEWCRASGGTLSRPFCGPGLIVFIHWRWMKSWQFNTSVYASTSTHQTSSDVLNGLLDVHAWPVIQHVTDTSCTVDKPYVIFTSLWHCVETESKTQKAMKTEPLRDWTLSCFVVSEYVSCRVKQQRKQVKWNDICDARHRYVPDITVKSRSLDFFSDPHYNLGLQSARRVRVTDPFDLKTNW